MFKRRRTLRWILLLMFVGAGSLCLATPLGTAAAIQTGAHARGAPGDPPALQATFDQAAREFGVPERVLLAVSYNLSRWEDHGGAPSVAGGYGLMHLTQLDSIPAIDGKGDNAHHPGRPDPNDPSLHTLDRAAGLLGVSPETLKRDPAQNLRGGAVLLAQYADEIVGSRPADAAEWYSAVARYSGSQDAGVALDFANAVYPAKALGPRSRFASPSAR